MQESFGVEPHREFLVKVDLPEPGAPMTTDSVVILRVRNQVQDLFMRSSRGALLSANESTGWAG